MNIIRPLKYFLLLGTVALSFSGLARADANVSSATARSSPGWLRTGIVYEIYPRDFSAAGNLAGVTAKLDELHDLGVTILWTMPIHPRVRASS